MKKANSQECYRFLFKFKVRTAKHSLMKEVFVGMNGLVRRRAAGFKQAIAP